jgi:large subunit ribosomal protein L24
MGKAMRIRKNDNVMITTGAHRGQTGKIIKVFPEAQRVVVEGRNLIKRHTRVSAKNPKGGILEKEGSIAIANVLLICPKCSTPTRTGARVLEDQRKIRVCRNCGEMVE